MIIFLKKIKMFIKVKFKNINVTFPLDDFRFFSKILIKDVIYISHLFFY
jgi:hypothetical protein